MFGPGGLDRDQDARTLSGLSKDSDMVGQDRQDLVRTVLWTGRGGLVD